MALPRPPVAPVMRYFRGGADEGAVGFGGLLFVVVVVVVVVVTVVVDIVKGAEGAISQVSCRVIMTCGVPMGPGLVALNIKTTIHNWQVLVLASA